MARERKFWIGVGSLDLVEEAVLRAFCMLGHSTEAAMKAMHPGDGIALFARRPTDRSADRVDRFEAIGVIGPGAAWTRGRDGGVVRRIEVAWRPEAVPVAGEALASRLKFVKDPSRWRRAFTRDRIGVEREDFARIAEGMDLPGFAWEIRNDRGFGFAREEDDAARIAAALQLRREAALRMKDDHEGPFRMRKK